MKRILIIIMVVFGVIPQVMGDKGKTSAAAAYIATLKQVTDVMVNDVTSPVAASRYYAYVTLAAYEALSVLDGEHYPSFRGRIKDFAGIDLAYASSGPMDPSLVVNLAILKSGARLLPSGYMFKTSIDSLAALHQKTESSRKQFQDASLMVDGVVAQIFAYAMTDGFRKLNNLPRYTPRTGDAYWQPTAPSFMAPIEPHWKTLRTFLLDSAQQFKVKLPAPYDTSRHSSFYQQMREVYDIAKAADKEQQAIAEFWDCNPFAVQQIGHVEFGIKKISPGGHWIGITGIACLSRKMSLGQTALTHALVSFALADAFIACWDEKYRSNRVRPETAINRLIDPRWRPLLQTPPFPEYVSGHSVASSAAGVVLTRIFGPNFAFTDDSEVEFGLPVRKYSSFSQASAEASISRLYGGIHYRDAIDEGIWQGTRVGEWTVAKLPTYFK